MTGPRILVCTVGGSDQPIVTALRAAAWDHVVFVCTDASITMVTERVAEPARNAAPATTRLPIPAQADLAAAWSTLITPADDPDGVYAAERRGGPFLDRAREPAILIQGGDRCCPADGGGDPGVFCGFLAWCIRTYTPLTPEPENPWAR